MLPSFVYRNSKYAIIRLHAYYTPSPLKIQEKSLTNSRISIRIRVSSSGQGAIPYRRYSPRTPLAPIRCNSGTDSIVWMKEDAVHMTFARESFWISGFLFFCAAPRSEGIECIRRNILCLHKSFFRFTIWSLSLCWAHWPLFSCSLSSRCRF